MREGNIILLYKKGETRDPRNYRANNTATNYKATMSYEILAKILTNRLKQVIVIGDRSHNIKGPAGLCT
eukprot:scaffold185001_cov32-Tisochrysis_lutea.AAC.4